MITIPPGFNGAIAPKFKFCISQDCSTAKFVDTTGISNSITPFGWVPINTTPPFIRNIIAFSEIKVEVKTINNEILYSTYVYLSSASINLFPTIFSNEMALFSTPWGLDDGIYIVEYIFKYSDNPSDYGDPDNTLTFAGKTVVCKTNQIITCRAKNQIKDLWLKYLKECCPSTAEKALEAEALLLAVEAAASCGDEFNANSILNSLQKIMNLGKGCAKCPPSNCKC
jgi:hypothetical protein